MTVSYWGSGSVSVVQSLTNESESTPEGEAVNNLYDGNMWRYYKGRRFGAKSWTTGNM